MTNNPKSTQEAPPESPVRETPPAEGAPYTVFAALFHKGLERIAEMQKHTLDMVSRQTTDVLDTWKQAYPVPPHSPGASLLDVMDQGMERMARTQKGMIDLVVQQNARVLDMTKDRRETASKWTAGLVSMACETADQTAAAHKLLMDYAAGQNKAVASAMKRQSGIAGSAPASDAVDAIQRNVDMAIEAQKELMEAAAKPLKAAAGKQAA
jgi:hypothetical protein